MIFVGQEKRLAQVDAQLMMCLLKSFTKEAKGSIELESSKYKIDNTKVGILILKVAQLKARADTQFTKRGNPLRRPMVNQKSKVPMERPITGVPTIRSGRFTSLKNAIKYPVVHPLPLLNLKAGADLLRFASRRLSQLLLCKIDGHACGTSCLTGLGCI